MKSLYVFYEGSLVGKLYTDPTHGPSFQYDSSSPMDISISLPRTDNTYHQKEIEPFFSGLLPDGIIREQLAKNAHVSPQSWFRLLEAYGREIAGALEIIGEDESPSNPDRYEYEELPEHILEERIERASSTPLILWGDKAKMSLAGAQDKLALLYKDGRYYLPLSGAPSNVILKAGIDQYSLCEYITTKLASLLGLDVPDMKLLHFGKRVAVMTRRFDRIEKDGIIRRLHQEDMCQALSVLPENKYEENGGPCLTAIKALLLKKSSLPIEDTRKLSKGIVFNALVGNCDAHGKNYSILFGHDGTLRSLAPLYDLVSTSVFPELDRRLAMKIGREKQLDRLTREDILSSGIVGRKEMENTLDWMIEHLPHAFEEAGKTMEGNAIPLFERIQKDTEERIQRFMK